MRRRQLDLSWSCIAAGGGTAHERVQPIGRARRRSPTLLIAALAAACVPLAGACAALDDEIDIGRLEQAAVVSDFFNSSCSTSVVMGLSVQIADEVMCLVPDAMTRFEEGDGVVFSGGAVLPYLDPGGVSDLLAAVGSRGGELRINSAFRTVAQQYLLRAWYERGRCGITAAATPGRSNHESGRALDIGNYGDWRGALSGHGWQQTVPGDPVHFDHLASPDLLGYDVLAFQRLWNRNHPGDLIDEDGLYGPQTADRLARAPAEGFATGACGATPPYDGALVAIDAPPAVAPGARAEIAIHIENTGSDTWQPGATFLGTSDPIDRASDLHDPATWTSPSRPATVEDATPPGEVGTFRFTVLAPDADGTTLRETFRLVEEGVSWFGPATIELELLVSSAAPDALAGGCSTSNAKGRAPALLGLLVLGTVTALRRRRFSRG